MLYFLYSFIISKPRLLVLKGGQPWPLLFARNAEKSFLIKLPPVLNADVLLKKFSRVYTVSNKRARLTMMLPQKQSIKRKLYGIIWNKSDFLRWIATPIVEL